MITEEDKVVILFDLTRPIRIAKELLDEVIKHGPASVIGWKIEIKVKEKK